MTSERRIPKVDFHVHYDLIDEQTAYRAIDLAQKQNVVVVGLLARNEISDNYLQFVEYGKVVGVKVIPAVEKMIRLNGKRTDMICLGFDLGHLEIRRIFGRKENRDRNKKIAWYQEEFLNNLGFSFDSLDCSDAQVYNKILDGDVVDKAYKFCEIVSSPDCESNADLVSEIVSENFNFWKYVVDKYSYLDSLGDNRRSLIAKFLYCLNFEVDKPGYLYVQERIGPIQQSVKDVADIVHSAGGVVLYSPEGDFDLEVWERLKDVGIDGLMAWHAGRLGQNKLSSDVPIPIIVETRKSGLLVLGGSDYQMQDWKVGIGDGSMYISPRRYMDLVLYKSIKNGKNGF